VKYLEQTMANDPTPTMRHRLREERGQSVLEFAFVLPLLVALILFLVEFGLGMNQQEDATQVASQAARLAAVNSPLLGGGVASFVHGQVDTTPLQSAAVSVCFPNGTANVGDPVRVTVTSQFNITGFFIPAVTIPLAGSATMRLEQVPTNYTATRSC
jgi:Flp pilus assembly protein TadG